MSHPATTIGQTATAQDGGFNSLERLDHERAVSSAIRSRSDSTASIKKCRRLPCASR